jgi:hypothetical protein
MKLLLVSKRLSSRVLRYDNVDELISVENATVLAIAKKRNLVN